MVAVGAVSYQCLVLVRARQAFEVLLATQALKVAAADQQIHLDALDLFGGGGGVDRCSSSTAVVEL